MSHLCLYWWGTDWPSQPSLDSTAYSRQPGCGLSSPPLSSWPPTEAEDDGDSIALPTYNDAGYCDLGELEPPAIPQDGNPTHASIDDTAVRIEPSRHVDYLSHNWKEEDIWS